MGQKFFRIFARGPSVCLLAVVGAAVLPVGVEVVVTFSYTLMSLGNILHRETNLFKYTATEHVRNVFQ